MHPHNDLLYSSLPQLRLTEEERKEAVERLIAWWMTDAFPPVGSPSHPLPQPSTPKGRRRKKRSGESNSKALDVPNTRVFSTPRGTPQRAPPRTRARDTKTTLGDMSRWNDDKDKNDEKSGDDMDALPVNASSVIRPSPYATLLPRDAPDDGFLSPSLVSTAKVKGSTFVGDFFFRSTSTNNNKGKGKGGNASDGKGVLLPMYTTSLVLDEDDDRETKPRGKEEMKGAGMKVGGTFEGEAADIGTSKVGVTLEELGAVMGRGTRPTEKVGTVAVGTTKLIFEDEEDEDGQSDAASDTSSQAASLLLQAQASVSFDRFAQWFLGLANELGHRAGGTGRNRQGRRRGRSRAGFFLDSFTQTQPFYPLCSANIFFLLSVHPESDDDDPSVNQLTMNTPDRPRYYMSPSTFGFEGWAFLGFMGMGYNNENGGGDDNSDCDSENSFGGWSSI